MVGNLLKSVCCGEATSVCPVASWLQRLFGLCCIERGFLVEFRLRFASAGFSSYSLRGSQSSAEIQSPWFVFFLDWCKNRPNPVVHTPQKWLLLKLHWNRFPALFSAMTFKSSAKTGLSRAFSNNNSWRKEGWLLLPTRSAARHCIEVTLHRSRQAHCIWVMPRASSLLAVSPFFI